MPPRSYAGSSAAGGKASKNPHADSGRWTLNTRMGRRLAWSFTADTARPNPGEPRRCGSPGPICVFCVHLPASAKTLACLLRPVPHRALRLRMAGAPHRRKVVDSGRSLPPGARPGGQHDGEATVRGSLMMRPGMTGRNPISMRNTCRSAPSEHDQPVHVPAPFRRRLEIQHRPDRHDPGRVDALVAHVIVPLDVAEIDRRRDARQLVDIARVGPQVLVIDDPPDVALEVPVIDRRRSAPGW